MRIPEQARRAASAIFEAATALAFMFVAVAFFTSEGESLVRSPVGQTVAPFDWIWNSLYLAGGAAILLGLVFTWRLLEGVGLVALAWGLIANLIALASLNPDWRVVGYAAFASACLVRVVSLARE